MSVTPAHRIGAVWLACARPEGPNAAPRLGRERGKLKDAVQPSASGSAGRGRLRWPPWTRTKNLGGQRRSPKTTGPRRLPPPRGRWVAKPRREPSASRPHGAGQRPALKPLRSGRTADERSASLESEPGTQTRLIAQRLAERAACYPFARTPKRQMLLVRPRQRSKEFLHKEIAQ